MSPESMNPIATVIVDDEPAARKALVHLLTPDPEILVIAECRSGREAVRTIRERGPELLFLDVQMPGLDGFRVLREVEPERVPVVVFVTAYDKYALQAFAAHAIDYLLKPFSDARFYEALKEAKSRVEHRRLGDLGHQVAALVARYAELPTGEDDRVAPATKEPYLQRLLVRVDGRITPVRAADIDWIDAEGDYVRLRVGKASHVVRTTMHKIESQLDPARFVRIHRSTIVNLERVKELKPSYRGEYVAVLHDGTTLKLSRGSRELLESRLGREV
jgi:two-component system, LytTR family, response regulator